MVYPSCKKSMQINYRNMMLGWEDRPGCTLSG